MKIGIPQILVRRYIEPKDPISVGALGVSGHFHVIKKRRGIIVQELDFDNIITDVGLRRMASETRLSGTIGLYCILGTGTSTPVSTDTTLQAYGGYTTNRSYSLVESSLGSGADRQMRITYEYGLNDVIGTWTEVGITWDNISSNPQVFCRMLFTDDQGNPIAVEKTSEDTLTIIYTFHLKRLSDTPVINTINVEGVGDVDVSSIVLNRGLALITNREFSKNYFSGDYYKNYIRLGTGSGDILPTRTACYSAINTAPTLSQVVPYETGAFYREFLFEWPAALTGTITEAIYTNGSMGHFPYDNGPVVYMQFSPAVPKTDTTKKIRLRPRITFSRA